MFVTVALGAGIENFIEKNEEPSFFKIITYPDIYLPIIGFLVVAILGIILKKIFFNKK